MTKTISVYWPLAIVLALATVAFLHLCGGAVKHTSGAPRAASEVTAELARTVSFGFVGDEHEGPLQATHTANAEQSTTAPQS